jgi:hypothetical protein
MPMTTRSTRRERLEFRRGRRSRGPLSLAAMASGAASVALFIALAFASRADAYIYWSNDLGSYPSPNYGIGRAELSGQNEIKSFIPNVKAFSLEVGGGRIYWTVNNGNGTPWIGSANIDGTGATDQFAHIDTVPGDTYPAWGVDVGVGGGYFYWLGFRSFTPPADRTGYTIGRAKLDGSGAEQNLISDEGSVDENHSPRAIAADGDHVYWLYEINDYSYPYSPDQLVIGRANLNGTGVVPHFIDVGPLEIHGGLGLAVDAAHIYWGESTLNAIGRANLDGPGVNRQFVPASAPTGVEVDAQHIYWFTLGYGLIGRSSLDSSGANSAFFDPTGHLVQGLAVDGLSGPGGTGRSLPRHVVVCHGHRRCVIRVSCRPIEGSPFCRSHLVLVLLRVAGAAHGRRGADHSGRAAIALKRKKQIKAATGHATIPSGKTKTVKLKLTKKGKKAITAALNHGKKKLKGKIAVTEQNATRTHRVKVKLKRK